MTFFPVTGGLVVGPLARTLLDGRPGRRIDPLPSRASNVAVNLLPAWNRLSSPFMSVRLYLDARRSRRGELGEIKDNIGSTTARSPMRTFSAKVRRCAVSCTITAAPPRPLIVLGRTSSGLIGISS